MKRWASKISFGLLFWLAVAAVAVAVRCACR